MASVGTNLVRALSTASIMGGLILAGVNGHAAFFIALGAGLLSLLPRLERDLKI